MAYSPGAVNGTWQDDRGGIRSTRSDVDAVEGQGIWIGPEDRPLAARVWQPVGQSSGVGILLLPAVCYEYWSGFFTLRALAEDLARRGHLVLRIDYDGYGDSAGQQTDPDRWAHWNQNVDLGVAQLRDWGVSRVALTGVRVGATLALLGGERNQASAIAALLPVVCGRRYVRSVAMMQDEGQAPPEIEAGRISACGAILPEALQTDLRAIKLAQWDRPPAADVLVIERSTCHETSVEKMVEDLRSIGSTVTHTYAGGFDLALDQPEVAIAEEPVAISAQWLDETLRADPQDDPQAGPQTDAKLRDHAEIAWLGGTVRERAVSFGDKRLYGVETLPEGEERATVVFAETAVVHAGLARAWVEFARNLTLEGYHTVRVDFRGLGDSPDEGHLPSRPNADNAARYLEDLAVVVRELRASGHQRIVLAGLCFGGWVALRGAESIPVEGAIAVNAPFFWERGDILEALIERTRRRRIPEVAEFKAHGAELERTVPHETGDLLVALREGGSQILLVHSDDDDGLEFLRDRVPAGWSAALDSGSFSLAEIFELDHAMFNDWRRVEVLAAIRTFLDERIAAGVPPTTGICVGPAKRSLVTQL